VARIRHVGSTIFADTLIIAVADSKRRGQNALASRPFPTPIQLMQELPHTHSCFVCGESNPFGLKLRFQSDGRIVETRFTPRAEHVGFRGVIHGGIISTVLDEIMVWACAVQTKRFGYCAELKVRFLNPLAPGEEVLVRSELMANRKDRIYETKAAMISRAGAVLAEATGKYLPVKTADLTAMVTDFVGDAEWLLKK